jgi:hypothetical protein
VIGVGLDEDGPATALVDPDIVPSLFAFDEGSFEASAVGSAIFEGSTGLVFSLAISDEPAVAGISEVMGVVEGIELSLRRPCEPAPSLLVLSSSVISTGMDDGGGEPDMLDPWPRTDCVDDAIGRVIWGMRWMLGMEN